MERLTHSAVTSSVASEVYSGAWQHHWHRVSEPDVSVQVHSNPMLKHFNKVLQKHHDKKEEKTLDPTRNPKLYFQDFLPKRWQHTNASWRWMCFTQPAVQGQIWGTVSHDGDEFTWASVGVRTDFISIDVATTLGALAEDLDDSFWQIIHLGKNTIDCCKVTGQEDWKLCD